MQGLLDTLSTCSTPLIEVINFSNFHCVWLWTDYTYADAKGIKKAMCSNMATDSPIYVALSFY
jgi:hypothetical protein